MVVAAAASTVSQGEMWDAEFGAGLNRETSNNFASTPPHPHPFWANISEKKNGEIIAFDFFFFFPFGKLTI